MHVYDEVLWLGITVWLDGMVERYGCLLRGFVSYRSSGERAHSEELMLLQTLLAHVYLYRQAAGISSPHPHP